MKHKNWTLALAHEYENSSPPTEDAVKAVAGWLNQTLPHLSRGLSDVLTTDGTLIEPPGKDRTWVWREYTHTIGRSPLKVTVTDDSYIAVDRCKYKLVVCWL